MLSASEQSRLEALNSYAVLDTEPEEAFDRLTRLAAGVFSVSFVSVSLADSDRLWFQSRFGFETCQIERLDAFSNHAINSTEVFQGNNVSEDPRFRDFPSVSGKPGDRFYAEAPLNNAEGYTLGALCLLDVRPRYLPPQDIHRLTDLARLGVSTKARPDTGTFSTLREWIAR